MNDSLKIRDIIIKDRRMGTLRIDSKLAASETKDDAQQETQTPVVVPDPRELEEVLSTGTMPP